MDNEYERPTQKCVHCGKMACPFEFISYEDCSFCGKNINKYETAIPDIGVISNIGYIESIISAENPGQNIISPLAQLEQSSITLPATDPHKLN
jgi:hypothetical protein